MRCSKRLWESEISTGSYVLAQAAISGLCVRFVGTLRALSIYPVYPGKDPVVGPRIPVKMWKSSSRAPLGRGKRTATDERLRHTSGRSPKARTGSRYQSRRLGVHKCAHRLVYGNILLPMNDWSLNVWRHAAAFQHLAAPGVPSARRHPNKVTMSDLVGA